VKLVEFKGFLSEIIENKRSGVLKVYRKIFGDPLLYAYFLRGVPIYASSFVVSSRWYEGLLTRQEVDDNIFGNIFRYAYEKYKKRFIEHLISYSRNAVKEVLRALADNGWEVEVEFLPRSDLHIKESIGMGGKTSLEGWAKSILSIGATSVYIPRKDMALGMIKSNIVRKTYKTIVGLFGDVDLVYSTPFANVMVIHKDGEPLLIVTDISMHFDLKESFKNLLASTVPVVFSEEIRQGQEIQLPILDSIGRPFAISFRRDQDRYDIAIIKWGTISQLYSMDAEGVLNMVSEWGDRLSDQLYRLLEKIEKEKGMEGMEKVVDMRIRLIMMEHPHPEEFYQMALEKFGLNRE